MIATAATNHAETDEPRSLQRRVDLRLNLAMALSVCLSGLTLAGNPMTQSLPVIACLFAMVGLVFVDWLRWFSLPSFAAYLALGGIAIYSVNHLILLYSGDGMANEMQMVIVAELLVLVQAVLMLQEKNRRIYEQITIFCLLELIVASIFNDALSYGLILIPLGLVGLSSLALLQTYSVVDEVFWEPQRPPRPFLPFQRRLTPSSGGEQVASIEVSPVANADSIRAAGLHLPRVAIGAFAPAVLLIGTLYFYGLPRTSSTGMTGSGRTVTGFSDKVQLGQVGRMLQSRELAMRISLWETNDDVPYDISTPIYLRGNVLERYQFHSVRDGFWQAIDEPFLTTTTRLPSELHPRAGWPGDDVNIRVVLEPSSTDALFTVSPYRRSSLTLPDLLHSPERWTLRRRGEQKQRSRITYQFATNAFRDYRQSRFTPRWEDTASDEYLQQCLEFDPRSLPSVEEHLREAIDNTPFEFSVDDPLDVAQAVENHFTLHGQFKYSLDQPYDQDMSLNPIECFLGRTRSGSCQYFASAMVMMLRAHGIPARLVVGYQTDEFNPIGDYYVARQSHAHAWVEALIDREWVPPDERFLPLRSRWREDADTLTVEIPTENEGPSSYWVRFDPTPGGGGVPHATASSLSNFFELAQNLWSDLVVYRGNGREASGGGESRSAARPSLFGWFDEKLGRLRDARVGGGALAIGRQFSWPAALGGGLLALGVMVLLQLRLPAGWFWWHRGPAATTAAPAAPEVLFYGRMLELLKRLGVQRSPTQTPLEFAQTASEQLGDPELQPALLTLAEAFYDTRFGGKVLPQSWAQAAGDDAVQTALETLRRRAQPTVPLPKSLPEKD